ncbi:hypothetical protein Vadar_001180 [Vaccinium darrowii]|uniref:Uncharacterized protein n=1 Tax=Vaccinium darrowii TaxID=229202 RepID=A0ACB7Z8R6_9ERIC|nr:hypothetical protein Vadar_001180 [Vaccinium darrowii]
MHSSLRLLQNSGKWKRTRFTAEHLDGMQWKVMLVDSKDRDGAFYLTNGTIVVFTSLLGRLQSDAEVATLLGHEVRHGIARHVTEHFFRCLGLCIWLILISTPNPEINAFKFLLSFISRRREMEVDYIGMMLMASAGYDPRVAPRVFLKIDGSDHHHILSTHPCGRKRAEKLENAKVMEQAMAIYRDVTSGLEVAHGLARHISEEVMRCLGIVTFLPMLMFIPHSEVPLALVFSFYSWRMEMEADYIGMMLMASAGYDPQLAPTFRLERIPYSKRYHWVVRPPNGEFEASWRECGDRRLKELEEKYKDSIVPPNSPQSIRVNSILKEIVEAMHSSLRMQNSGKWKTTRFATEHLDGMQWKVVLVDSKDRDGARILPNGTIVVFTSLLGRLQSDAEVATLLGHEVGHGLALHMLEEVSRCLRTFTFLPMLMFIPHSEVPLALVFSFYFRRREMEADYIGMMLIASAGYDPKLVPTCLESHGDPSSYHGKFDTHLSGHKRAKKLKEPKVMEQAMAIYNEVTSGRGVRSSV